MKINKLIWVLAALLIIVALFAFRNPKLQKPSQSASVASNSTPPAVATPSTAPNQNASSSSDPDAPADIVSKYRQGLIDKEEAMRQALVRQNEKTQNYYGKIVDQDGQPISGVEVTGSIVIRGGLGDGAVNQTYTTQSDSNGQFEFVGKKGWQLNVIVKKEGYLMGARGEGYQGTPGEKTTPSNRALLVMWKLRGAETLVSSSIDAKIPHDETSVKFDTATGKESVDGDLQISLVRSPSEVRRSGQTFDWSLKIEMLRGGLMVENDVYPYWAPDNGYTPTFEVNMSSNNPTWFSKLTQNFYIKNAQGQYGRMQAVVYSALTPARIQFGFTFNPSGSQNLEPILSK